MAIILASCSIILRVYESTFIGFSSAAYSQSFTEQRDGKIKGRVSFQPVGEAVLLICNLLVLWTSEALLLVQDGKHAHFFMKC